MGSEIGAVIYDLPSGFEKVFLDKNLLRILKWTLQKDINKW